MENWVNIISFDHTMHVYLPKTKLESEGIEVILQDELSSHISPADIGGVKLLVKEEDFDRAHDLLNEWGYHLDDDKSRLNKFLILFDEYTSQIPVFRKWIIEMRVVVAVTAFIFLLFALVMVYWK